MANDTTAMSLYQIIGAPLHALVRAEAQAAMTTAEFIREFGFTPSSSQEQEGEGSKSELGNDEYGELRFVTFRRSSTNSDGESEETEFKVPMLSLLPIPALQIRHADLDFCIKVVESNLMGAQALPDAAKDSSKNGTDDLASSGDLPNLIDFKASLGRDGGAATGSRKMDTQIKMKIRMEQADMPNGLAKMLSMLGENVTAKSTPKLNKK